MSRTLVVTNDFPPRRGGIEAFVYSLCDAMPPDEVVVYTARMTAASAFDAGLGFPVIRDPAPILLPTWRVGRAVRRVARDYDCDRVVFGAAAPLGLLARGLRATGVRWIVGITHGHEVWWAKVPLWRRLLRRIGDDVDELTYVSEFCRREISAALSVSAAAKMRRLSPTVDRTRFGPDIDPGIMRRRWGIGADRPVVLTASRLVRRKGQDTLIGAWSMVVRQHDRALLVIVGDGPSKRRLVRMVRRRGLDQSVVFEAGVDWREMPLVYAAADVFALPCRTRLWGLEPEAFGIVFLEAAASGLPVVVGNSGGAPEAAHCAEVVRVVTGSSVTEVAGAVTELVSRVRQR